MTSRIDIGISKREIKDAYFSPHLGGKKAAQNQGFAVIFLPIAFDTLTGQRSNYLLFFSHMALNAQDSSHFLAVPSHPKMKSILRTLLRDEK